MFIDQIITEIWKPVTKQYKEAYEAAKKLSAEELYERHIASEMKYFPYIGVNMNYIDTCGCPYRMAGGQLSGCSMCDYQSELAKRQGSLLALREMSPALYAKAVKQGFINSRGENAKSNVIENVSGYDSLDHSEVPEELCEELFREDIFEDAPFIYNVEARASTVTEERLKSFKKSVANRKRVSIDFGVEVSDEWIRNEWLNKSVTNAQIQDAVELLHKNKFKAVGNVLFGVPGLTEEQMIEVFVNSVLWMDSIGIDKIVIHVLNRKQYTLQGYIYQKLRNDEELLEKGLVQGEHTGLPWVFSVIRGLEKLYRKKSDIFKKAVVTRVDVNFNSISNKICYNEAEGEESNKYIDYINGLALNNKYDTLKEMVETIKQDTAYKAYEALLEKQKKCGSFADTFKLMGKKLAQCVGGDNWETLYSEFEIPEKFMQERGNKNE
ncbi:radical SAM protein [[Clostridium] polysaccharolyticum]|uniref:Elp3/MiaA/NifB-like radical SAM core domain-containing protein n=1 Tax=[Clostridium] polysaccharolyticum TaxID=29364 RepID=A0A1I0C3U2_9FIRM|nr:radical SAM protein [[Clostridium] polysaccharolyticum]SET14128.1 hypothetical protein SAMN04487772_10911 [[Clostridium] polysaccharolyticum]